MERGSTIAAIATARGEAALSIVRMSGPKAVEVASGLFRGADLTSASGHTAHFGRVYSRSGVLLDEAVATVFRAPKSSTGEDVVEFTCHGGDAVPSAVLAAMLESGAEPAEPGEFTKRAFLNGKLDLEQAEAVIDLIHSRSVAAHRVSVRQLQGRFKERLAALSAGLLRLCGLVELELDFGEEDLEFADRGEIRALLSEARQTVEEMLLTASHSGKWREGLRVVIAGKPNAGKSTLMNALVGEERVIVSDQPGTTRDFVDVDLDLDGLTLRLTDTAGIRNADDPIEAEGVRFSEALTRRADVLLYVFDTKTALSGAERALINQTIAENDSLGVVLVANKADLLTGDLVADFASNHASGSGLGLRSTQGGGESRISVVSVSALEMRASGEGLEALLEGIRQAIPASLRDYEASDGMINERHAGHLREAQDAIVRVERLLATERGGELLALDLRAALTAIGSITGEYTNEDILSEIFSRFCIGK